MTAKQILNSLRSQLPNERVIASPTKAYTHADRKAFFTNYNADLVNRISEIKRNK